MMRYLTAALILVLPLADLAFNATHLNCGLTDIYGLLGLAHGMATGGAWPATPYFPAGYPLLLIPGGWLGHALLGGYVISAGGLTLALWALYRLVRELGAPRWLGALALVLAWLLPTYRIVAGSPSVDALYSGLALWFIAAGTALWRLDPRADMPLRPREIPRWVGWGMVVPALTLPLVRYHAAVLLLPVLAVLVLARPRLRALLTPAWLALIAAFLFNETSYYLHYGTLTPSALAIQLRTGLEYRYALHYPTPEALYHDYQRFCAEARTGSLIADYGWSRIVAHTAKDWLTFLRRPPVALALVLVVLSATLLRRGFPRGAGLLGIWLATYCLALSPAYYTARAAALPALAGLAIVLVLAFTLAERRLAGLAARLGLGAIVVLLLAGSVLAGNYARLIRRERLHYAALSQRVAGELRELHAGWRRVITNDVRVLPLDSDPWGLPFAHTGMFWTDDPLVEARQAPGLIHFSEGQVALAPQGYDWLLLVRGQPSAKRWDVIQASGNWEVASESKEYVVYRRVPKDANKTVSGGA